MNEGGSMAGGSRGISTTGGSDDFDAQHTYVIQGNRCESQDEDLEGAGMGEINDYIYDIYSPSNIIWQHIDTMSF